jgi:DNA polymerase
VTDASWALEVENLRQEILVCTRCLLGHMPGLHAPWRGSFRKGIVLFVGEAPGPDEIKAGEPFIGRAGKLLQTWLDGYLGLAADGWLLCNAVACMPRDLADAHFRAPRVSEISACRPWLNEIVRLSEPRAIVAVGRVAEHATDHFGGLDQPTFLVPHPSWFLRTGKDWTPYVARLRSNLELTA